VPRLLDWPFLVGLGLGSLVTALIAWGWTLGYVQRVRAAERRARAAERLAEIGSMTGGLAHEIRNPLSTIGLNAGLLVEGIEDLDVASDAKSRLVNRTKALRRETERLGDILRDFLEFAGKVHLERRTIDLRDLVADLVDFFTPDAERQGVRLQLDRPEQPVNASVDPRHLKQAVLNLMINATQAMAGARGEADRPRLLLLRVRAERDLDNQPVGVVHVIDTGPGIDAETLARIFNPYFTTKAGGTGLGLPMSRRLIEEHGGRLDVHSEVGKGSDFKLVVPMDIGNSRRPASGE
jgi:signal transduction histidine kinase